MTSPQTLTSLSGATTPEVHTEISTSLAMDMVLLLHVW